jgi:hypothetical protein
VPTSSVQATKSFNTAPGSTLELQGQSDTSQVTLSPLDKQEFVRGTTTAIKPDVLAYYVQQGYPPSMLLHLFVREIRVFDQGVDPVHTFVNTPLTAGAGSYRQFDAVINGLSACYIHTDTINFRLKQGDASVPSVKMPGAPDFGDFGSLIAQGYAMLPDVTTKDQYFLVQQKSQLVFDYPAEPVRKKLCKAAYTDMGIPAPDDGDDADTATKSASPRERSIANAAKLLDPELPPASATKDRRQIAEWIAPFELTLKNPHFEVVLRSPEAVIYYLGEISREQMFGPYKTGREVALDHDARTYIGALDLRGCYTAKKADDGCEPRCVPMFMLFTAHQSATERAVGIHPLPNAASLPQTVSCYLPDSQPVQAESEDVGMMNEHLLYLSNLQVDYADQTFTMPWDVEEHTETMTAFSITQQIVGLQTNATELPTTGLVKAVP